MCGVECKLSMKTKPNGAFTNYFTGSKGKVDDAIDEDENIEDDDGHVEIKLNGEHFRMGIVFRLFSMTTFKWLHFNYELLLSTHNHLHFPRSFFFALKFAKKSDPKHTVIHNKTR